MDCLKMNFYSDNRLPRLSTDFGSAIQHLHYLPFGEEQIDQRLTNFNSRYTFSAKEKDIETGYSYFGARYYTSDLSIWLSVDPLSDKYPSLTPYNYCTNNPVILVDPDGRAFGGPDNPPKNSIHNGVLTTTGGVIAVVTGVSACLTGVGAPAGGVAISLGIPAIGLGIGQIIDGVRNEGQANIPGGVGETVGQSIDKVSNNEQNSFAKIGEFLDILSGGKPQNAAEGVVTGLELLKMGLDGNDNSTSPKANNNTSQKQNNGESPKQNNSDQRNKNNSENKKTGNFMLDSWQDYKNKKSQIE